MNKTVKKLRSEFNRIKDNLQEENLKVHLIKDTFLEYCGYDTKKCIFEKPTVKGFCDIFVPTIGDQALAIEVKTGKEALKTKDIAQAYKYARDKRQRFALLTNGYEYVLLDLNMDLPPILEGDGCKSYVVFWFNIFESRGKELTELKYFKYLNFENLYKKKSTLFYCDIAQYREWKLEQGLKAVSWTTYRCTLYNFFDYYSQKVLSKNSYAKLGNKVYEKIDMEVFDEFIREYKSDDVSTQTLNNNHTHIYNMLYELQKHGNIRFISLSDSRKQDLMEYEETQRKKIYAQISTEDVQTILNFLRTKRHSTRDSVIFLLTVVLGLERSQLINLQWDAFTNNFKYITVKNRKIELPPIIQEYLIKLNNEKKKEKIRSPFLFQVLYKKRYKPMKEWNINDVFNKFAQITNDDKWKDYSPKFVRNSLIPTLFSANYSLEDIMYITGIDINNISKLIKMDDILKRRSKRIDWTPLYDGILV